jgi:hypothetical protein
MTQKSGQTRICKVCKQRFSVLYKSRNRISDRQTCSKKCANTVTRNAWSKQEHEILLELASTMPINSLHRTYNSLASRHKFQCRTEAALRVKLQKLGISVVPCVEFFSINQIAEMLGFPYKTVSNWHFYGLKVIHMNKCRRSRRYVTRIDLKRFLKKRPHFFGGANRLGLQAILENIDAVDQFLTQHPKRNKKPPTSPNKIAIRCIETQEEFETITAAAVAIKVNPSVLAKAVKNNHRCRQMHWEIIQS